MFVLIERDRDPPCSSPIPPLVTADALWGPRWKGAPLSSGPGAGARGSNGKGGRSALDPAFPLAARLAVSEGADAHCRARSLSAPAGSATRPYTATPPARGLGVAHGTERRGKVLKSRISGAETAPFREPGDDGSRADRSAAEAAEAVTPDPTGRLAASGRARGGRNRGRLQRYEKLRLRSQGGRAETEPKSLPSPTRHSPAGSGGVAQRRSQGADIVAHRKSCAPPQRVGTGVSPR